MGGWVDREVKTLAQLEPGERRKEEGKQEVSGVCAGPFN
jgi:hypothetical protein